MREGLSHRQRLLESFDSPLEFLRFKQRCDLKNKIRFKSETLMKREKKCHLLNLFTLQNGKLHFFVRESGEPEAISVHQRRSGSQVSQEWERQSSESTAPCPVQGKEYVGFHCLHY